MKLFWNISADSSSKIAWDEVLICNRWVVVLSTISGASMVIVLVRTYKHSRYPYLVTCSAMMFLGSLFRVLATILFNWYHFCKLFYEDNDRCHGKPSEEWVANVLLFDTICLALSDMFYYNGHFLFAYRYFEVAEMFGREDKT
jgi:hypothetical protein